VLTAGDAAAWISVIEDNKPLSQVDRECWSTSNGRTACKYTLWAPQPQPAPVAKREGK
jgi:hypothetical protein